MNVEKNRDPRALELSELNLRPRVLRALRYAGIFTVQELIVHSEGELRRLPDFGRTALQEIQTVLGCLGLSLATKGSRLLEHRLLVAQIQLRKVALDYNSAKSRVNHLTKQLEEQRANERKAKQ